MSWCLVSITTFSRFFFDRRFVDQNKRLFNSYYASMSMYKAENHDEEDMDMPELLDDSDDSDDEMPPLMDADVDNGDTTSAGTVVNLTFTSKPGEEPWTQESVLAFIQKMEAECGGTVTVATEAHTVASDHKHMHGCCVLKNSNKIVCTQR